MDEVELPELPMRLRLHRPEEAIVCRSSADALGRRPER
jgi:hypothetical protein